MLVDWFLFRGNDPHAWFCAQVGWDGAIGEFFNEFSTIVFLHFDLAMEFPGPARQLVLSLAADSARTGRFNVLVCISSALHAHALLRIEPRLFALLGPAYCGRCTEKQVVDAGLADPIWALSGTLGLAAASQSLRELRVGKAIAEWHEGEGLLNGYRTDAMV